MVLIDIGNGSTMLCHIIPGHYVTTGRHISGRGRSASRNSGIDIRTPFEVVTEAAIIGGEGSLLFREYDQVAGTINQPNLSEGLVRR
jgi:hypothetical protein